MLKEVIDGEDGEDTIEADCIYGEDETGIQNENGTSEQVVGAAGASIQHQTVKRQLRKTLPFWSLSVPIEHLLPQLLSSKENHFSHHGSRITL